MATEAVRFLVVWMAGWVHSRGHPIGRNTAKRVLRGHGLEPAPARGKRMPWKTFLRTHLGAIAAADFFSVEVLTLTGLVRSLVRFVIDLQTGASSPNLNSVAERFVLSIKSECLSKLVPLGENHLRRVVSEYIERYHCERNHQGVGNRLLTPTEQAVRSIDGNAPVERHERLGGLLNFYYRRAA